MLNEAQRAEFCRLRRQIIELDYMNLNPQQRQAVMTAEGPLLLLAGAGSGKTTVLIHRIACLLKYGQGAESDQVADYVEEDDLYFLRDYLAHPGDDPQDVARKNLLCAWEPAVPWSIIAITFTNKAAGELKDRLERLLGQEAEGVWASTFHSACVRILRRDIERLGMSSSFTIYDMDDSQRVIKDILKDFNLDEKMFNPKTVLGYISRAKDAMKMGPEYLEECQQSGDVRQIQIAKIYVEYQKRLWDAAALDFDDIIFHTVRLLQQDESVRRFYQNKFRYVLIDEYQDTNNLQYLLASLLAGKWENICVVGDDDQSIYRFRGATIENILSFEQQYRGAKVIRLEQNYRSTGNILAASNAVISNNQGRKGKTLWTEHPDGDKITLYSALNESEEAQFVANKILADYGRGGSWKNHAILYRMNVLSRELEYALKRNGIPYRIIGGTRYFDRAEVKDMLAYLCAIHNPEDDLRLRRIINVPARGIGAKTLETAQQIAAGEGRSLYDVVRHAADYPQLGRGAAKLTAFADLLDSLREKAQTMELPAFYEEVLAATGYLTALSAKDSVENRSRIENVKELASSIEGYLENAGEELSLGGFLDEIALYTDLDSFSGGDNSVVLMTMHAAKGLEFLNVYVVGMEEGIFPSVRAIGEPEEMEEERRLCYVAMTRAKECLTLTCAAQRMLYGRTSSNRPSRFTREIPDELLSRQGRGHQTLREMTAFSEDPDDEPGSFRRPRYEQRSNRSGGSYGYGRKPRPTAGAPAASFRKGDMVEHSAFGTGMILSVQPMGGDALVEIAFDTVGTKRLMLNTASKHMTRKQ
ncbi:MAG: UvrD-helicase domain-containing protein [Oscillospiraceae bacterium]|nr:UvrD-helicase domain-containing protein [Oscillospiraceae bacterium]